MYKNILHATDLAKDHFYMCEQAANLANKLQARLYIMHIIEPPTSLQIAQGLGFTEIYNPSDAKENAISILKMIGESLNIPVESQFVEIGSIKQHVVDKVQELECNLVVIGHRSQNNLPEFLESTAHLVVNDAPCDVLTINSLK
ncbi:MAG: universal stress protein [Legionellaceae bacterium]|nr:universal stress protein [Legionellaceae bacterium]